MSAHPFSSPSELWLHVRTDGSSAGLIGAEAFQQIDGRNSVKFLVCSEDIFFFFFFK